MRVVARGWGVLVALLLAACAAQPAEPLIAFATSGGDAWAQQKLIAGHVAPDACDAVRITGPDAVITTRPLGGDFQARVPLQAGENHLTAECLKNGAVRATDRQDWSLRLADTPHSDIRIVPEGRTIHLDAGASTPASDPAPLARFEWRLRSGDPPWPGLPAAARSLTLPAPVAEGDYHPTLTVTDTRGRRDQSQALLRVEGGRARVVDPMMESPRWIDDAVVYGVAPQLFGPRGLPDVTARLDEIASVGVNTLWLSPVMDSPEGDYGYAVRDYFQVRSSYGGAAALHRLVQAAHAKGMRVILDMVPNHLSDLSPYFRDAVERGSRSPYYGFFARDAQGNAAHYFDWTNLENLDYDNPEVQRIVIEACARALREFDVDGFRMDAAWGPRRRAPEFWLRWRAALTRIKPDIFLLAEASARDPYYVSHGFDAAYDWTEQLGRWAWQDAFDHPQETVRLLREALAASPGSQVFRFLDNNDTLRFVTRYGVARTRVAAAMLMTLPGIPGLFMGDEVGAEFKVYGSSAPIDWTDRYGLRDWYKRLIALRHAQPALRRASLQLLDAAPDVLAYRRGDIRVYLNYGEWPRRIAVPRHAVDLLSGKNVAGRSLRLQPYDVFIFTTPPSGDRGATSRGRGSARPAPGR